MSFLGLKVKKGKFLSISWKKAPPVEPQPPIQQESRPLVPGEKLNIGCGFDYREGFVNVDGNAKLPRVDLVLDLPRQSLREHFGPAAPTGRRVAHVLASDFIEHHTHWEAVGLLKDFFAILEPGGTLELRLPDFDAISNYPNTASPQKIMMLFGGQDIPQGDTDLSHRRNYPQYYCHKYAYTKETITEELSAVGFGDIATQPCGTNMIVTACKPLSGVQGH